MLINPRSQLCVDGTRWKGSELTPDRKHRFAQKLEAATLREAFKPLNYCKRGSHAFRPEIDHDDVSCILPLPKGALARKRPRFYRIGLRPHRVLPCCNGFLLSWSLEGLQVSLTRLLNHSERSKQILVWKVGYNPSCVCKDEPRY